MRTSDLGQAQRMTTILQTVQSRIQDQQVAVATGQKAQRYADIAGDAGLLVGTRALRASTAAFAAETTRIVDRLNATDGTLSELGDIASSFRSLLLQRVNGGSTGAAPITPEIDQLLGQVASALNLEVGDTFVFAGSRSSQPPVSVPAPPPATLGVTDYYQGDSQRLTLRSDQGPPIAYGVTADEPPFADLLGALATARDADSRGDTAGLQAALDQVTKAIAGLGHMRGDLGATSQRLSGQIDRQQSTLTYLDQVISRIQDTDVPTAMTQIAADSTNLQAAYITISQLANLSLADYLR
jgi:flagellar hook-associated protein 3 FlgL